MKYGFGLFLLLACSLNAMQEKQTSQYNNIIYAKSRDRTDLSMAALKDSLVYANGNDGFIEWKRVLQGFLEEDFAKNIKSSQVSAYNLVHRWRLATSNPKVRRNLKQFGGRKELDTVSATLKSYGDKSLEEIAERIRRPVILDAFTE